jgi:hypothetical protein
LINLAATPGLGSLIARRYWAGTGQLLLALAGFGLIVAWMCVYFHRVFLHQLDEPAPTTPFGWLGKWGLICFVTAWVWSLVTSISFWCQAAADDGVGLKSVPPRLANLPGKDSDNQ